MVVLLSNYAESMGIRLPLITEATTFADSGEISPWTKPTVEIMQASGNLSGKSDNCFDSKGAAMRVETAAVPKPFVGR